MQTYYLIMLKKLRFKKYTYMNIDTHKNSNK